MPYLVDPLFVGVVVLLLLLLAYFYSNAKRERDAESRAKVAGLRAEEARSAVDEGLAPDGMSYDSLKEVRVYEARKRIKVWSENELAMGQAEANLWEGAGMAVLEVVKARGLSQVHIDELTAEDAAAIEAARRRDEYVREKARLDGSVPAQGPGGPLPGPGGSGPGGGEPPPGPGGGHGKAAPRHRK